MTELVHKVRAPWFPRYSEVRQLLTILEGVPKVTIKGMIAAVWEQTGTPQQPVDWSDPATWIEQRLTGEQAKLAQQIWEQSQQQVNPRYIDGTYLFINAKAFFAERASVCQLIERGKAFLTNDPGVIRQIDDEEGVLYLLSILATKKRAMRGDLLPEWGDYLREYSHFHAEASIKDTLRRRLVNLTERGLVEREGNSYTITQAGIDYAASVPQSAADPRREMERAVLTFNEKEREALRKRLSTMSPYLFEHLIAKLLEAMGYEDVTVTKASGDLGVDVLATIQFGITTITEVVQVKRHQSSINRPILDQLRGVLPLHHAIRGTLITLGKFGGGCIEAAIFPGAAPITLIDGEKLLDLLIQHQIGMRHRPITLYELDEEFFQSLDERRQIKAALNGDGAT
jgi:restriction system protein